MLNRIRHRVSTRSNLHALLLLVGLATFAPCAELEADDSSALEAKIVEAAEKFVAAYNGKDAAAIGALFGPLARVEEADGTLVEGQAEIQAAFAAVFAADPKAAISVSMDSIRMVTPDVAVEEGSTEYYPDGETLTSRSRYIVVHLKQDGLWKMASVRTMQREVVSNYEHLRALEWMVGEWVDESPDAVVKTSIRWDDDRNFLLQEFEVHDEHGLALKGSQRLGWDPQAKQIRSWIFDHSGAFGEARWAPTDEGWTAKVSGVGADGEAASATRRFQPQGNDRVVVTTTDRVLGNESMPDTIVTMVRRPPAPRAASTTR